MGFILRSVSFLGGFHYELCFAIEVGFTLLVALLFSTIICSFSGLCSSSSICFLGGFASKVSSAIANVLPVVSGAGSE